MGNVEKLVPKGGMRSREFILHFLEKWGDELDGVVILGMHKDGDAINGWSSEIRKSALCWLGAIEQLKMDFWNTLFDKRTDAL